VRKTQGETESLSPRPATTGTNADADADAGADADADADADTDTDTVAGAGADAGAGAGAGAGADADADTLSRYATAVKYCSVFDSIRALTSTGSSSTNFSSGVTLKRGWPLETIVPLLSTRTRSTVPAKGA